MQGPTESGFPLYKQLIERIKYNILTGQLEIKRKLTPPKALGSKLGINKNTIITAYKQLENEGFLMTQNGHGTYVASIPAGWESKEACKELITLAQTAQQSALKLGFTEEAWFMVVFNQTILQKTIPADILFDGEVNQKEREEFMLYVANYSESPEVVAKELRGAFVFHLPVKVCTLTELKSSCGEDLIKNAYCIYTLVPLVEAVETIVKPYKKKVTGLPYWLKAEYPWE